MIKNGFGELGAGGARPSGIAFGFYVQLGFYSNMWNQAQAKAGLSQSMYKSKGTMENAGIAAVAGTALQVIGTVAGAGAGLAFSSSMNFMSSIIQTDPVTGKVVIKSSDQAVMNLGVSLASGSIMGSFKGKELSDVLGRSLTSLGSEVIKTGAKYDGQGNLDRFSMEAGDWEAASIRTALDIAGNESAQHNIMAGVIGASAAQVAAEHIIAHNYKGVSADTNAC